MNTGFVRLAVATVPTVYGIETLMPIDKLRQSSNKLQQYLPFTVLKLNEELAFFFIPFNFRVATVPTVYGIETQPEVETIFWYNQVATVPTVYGIETFNSYTRD